MAPFTCWATVLLSSTKAGKQSLTTRFSANCSLLVDAQQIGTVERTIICGVIASGRSLDMSITVRSTNEKTCSAGFAVFLEPMKSIDEIDQPGRRAFPQRTSHEEMGTTLRDAVCPARGIGPAR